MTYFELPKWVTISVSGNDRIEFLNGVVTLDVATAKNWKRACFLTPKGKIRSVFWLKAFETEILIIAHPLMRDNLVADLLKYKLNIAVKLDDLSQERPSLQFKLDPLFPVIPGFELTGNFIWCDTETSRSYEHLLASIFLKGGISCNFGIGLNPVELGMYDAISLHKGCFLGQETISRMVRRGKPRTKLWMLKNLKDETNKILTSELGKITVVAKLSDDSTLKLCSVPFSLKSEGLKRFQTNLEFIHEVGINTKDKFFE